MAPNLLLDVPPEIRNIIYELVLTSPTPFLVEGDHTSYMERTRLCASCGLGYADATVIPDTDDEDAWTEEAGVSDRQLRRRTRWPRIRPTTQIQFLRTNKQISREARCFFLKNTFAINASASQALAFLLKLQQKEAVLENFIFPKRVWKSTYLRNVEYLPRLERLLEEQGTWDRARFSKKFDFRLPGDAPRRRRRVLTDSSSEDSDDDELHFNGGSGHTSVNNEANNSNTDGVDQITGAIGEMEL
ncbi:MAG: hypothetical protein M1831_005555 [Alyxoria varia]|nr:MAG: hypothetical protein M1831_005555 [Alyxoria varia]